MKRAPTMVVGVVLVIIGAYLLLAEYGLTIRFHVSWPLILIVIGGALIAAFYTSKPRTGFLIGGCIVLWLGAFFIAMENYFEYRFGYSRLWPGFIIVIGLANITAALLSEKARKNFAPGVILLGIGGACLLYTFGGWHALGFTNLTVLAAVVIILLGFKLIVDFFVRKGKA